MATFDDLVAFGPYIVSFFALIVAFLNFWYTYIKDRPKIAITFRNAKITSYGVDVICIHVTNTGGRPVTVLFPDIILPNGKILYLTPEFFVDRRKQGLEPSLAVGAQRIPRTYFQDRGKWGVTPAFPRALAPGALNEVWIKNADLAAKLKEKELGYDSGEVNLKVSVPDASQKPHVSDDEIIFDVDKQEWRSFTRKKSIWEEIRSRI
jgi:hypothetical protein